MRLRERRLAVGSGAPFVGGGPFVGGAGPFVSDALSMLRSEPCGWDGALASLACDAMLRNVKEKNYWK